MRRTRFGLSGLSADVLGFCSGLSCDDCDKAIGGARLFCLDCQPPKGRFNNTIDLCDNPDCYNAIVPTTKRTDLERPHVPEHDMVKIRTVVQDGELPAFDRRAKQALEACRARFQETTTEPPEEVASSDPSTPPEQPATVQKSQVLEVADSELLTEGNTPLPDGGVQNALPIDVTAQGAGVSTDATPADPLKGDQVKEEEESVGILCGVCHEQVERPCWFCIDCHARGTFKSMWPTVLRADELHRKRALCV